MINTNKQSVDEVWAVLDLQGKVMYSRGGSSTKPKLLIYPTESMAKRVLTSQWIKQIIPDSSQVKVKKIYSTE